jgi:hypothetical protein
MAIFFIIRFLGRIQHAIKQGFTVLGSTLRQLLTYRRPGATSWRSGPGLPGDRGCLSTWRQWRGRGKASDRANHILAILLETLPAMRALLRLET